MQVLYNIIISCYFCASSAFFCSFFLDASASLSLLSLSYELCVYL
jgi:hypothetical protein